MAKRVKIIWTVVFLFTFIGLSIAGIWTGDARYGYSGALFLIPTLFFAISMLV